MRIDVASQAVTKGKTLPWLVLAGVFGFGGISLAIAIGELDPVWCKAPYVGCLGVMSPLAVGGWISGLMFSIRSVSAIDRFKVLAWIILLWNALGVGLSVVLYFMIITR